LYGETGDDGILGDNGADRLHGGAGEDYLNGEEGDDRVFAVDGDKDDILCGSGTDTVEADAIDEVANGCENVTRQ